MNIICDWCWRGWAWDITWLKNIRRVLILDIGPATIYIFWGPHA